MLEKPEVTQEVLFISPILKDSPFRNFTFEIFAAFANAESIHKITFEQLKYLAEKGRMKVTLKIKEEGQ